MSVALGLFFVKLPDFVRTTTFRLTSTVFAACILLFSAFVYWEAAAYMLAGADAAIVGGSFAIAAGTPGRRVKAIEDRRSGGPRRRKIAGLFRAGGNRVAGQ